MVLLMCLAIVYEVSGIWFCCFFHTLFHQAYGSWYTGRAQALGSRRIMGYQDESRLFVIIRDQAQLAACVSLECVEFRECFVVSQLGGDIYLLACPQLERAAIQSAVPPSLIAPLRVCCDRTLVPFIFSAFPLVLSHSGVVGGLPQPWHGCNGNFAYLPCNAFSYFYDTMQTENSVALGRAFP